MEAIDALDRRDRWRTLWAVITHDSVFATLTLSIVLAVLAQAFLPQAPGPGTPRSLEQWFAEIALQLGAAFEPLQSLGLISIAQTGWVRIALVLFLAVGLARLIDRLLRALADRTLQLTLDDEQRLRVTDAVLSVEALSDVLRKLRYRVRTQDDALNASRAPTAALLSALWHAGAIIAGLGLLTNIAFGWDVASELLQPGTPTTLRDGVTLTLDADQASTTTAAIRFGAPDAAALTLSPGSIQDIGTTRVELRSLAPGYRISATATNKQALLIRSSNYLSPTSDVRLSFGAEKVINIAVPDAQAALTISEGDGTTPDRVQILSIGSAQLIADQPIAPRITITNATFAFAPNINAVVNVRHRPGNLLLIIGLPLALLFLAFAVLLPMRRMIIRQHGGWTEVYASGRGVRGDVRRMIKRDEV
jgi:hypothetical protein